MLWSIQKERISRKKHHWGSLGDLVDIYGPRLSGLDEPIDLVVEGYSSDAEIANLEQYRREIEAVVRFTDGPRIKRISHHLSHLYSAFHPSNFATAAVMIIDYQGSPVRDFTESWAQREAVPDDWLEVASFYVTCRSAGVKCVAKQLWNQDRSQPTGLGQFYQGFSVAIFPGQGAEGKAMGLAPYGRLGRLGLPPLAVDGWNVLIPDEWCRAFNSSEYRFSEQNFQNAADLAAEGQNAFEEALMVLARRLRAETGLDSLCLVGGCALNCAANGRLLRESGFEHVFVPPAPHDGGTALGCAVYGMQEVIGYDRCFKWRNDYLGPPQSDAVQLDVVRSLDEALTVTEKPQDLAGRIAELIDQQNVVGLYQPCSESGPRALGNRSLLADSRPLSMWRYINARIKDREAFRPFAPVVREELVSKYFEIDRASPFMQFVAAVRPEYRDLLAAVTHVDGTARLQTVSRDQNPLLYEILLKFEERSGVGVLLNTSFNGRGEPIVETPAEAASCFMRTDLHALAMPPFLTRKRKHYDVDAA